MRISPPDDWNGQDWECIQIQWPSSQKWIAILAGLITSPARGRFWDERHGSVTATQAIGNQIDAANFPFVNCDGEAVTIDTRYIRQFVEAEESDFLMSLCGYNPKAFKIENGSLWVRDFCGEWVEIGALPLDQSAPDPELIPTPLPGGANDATPCAIARKLARTTYDIVVASFSAITGAVLEWGWVDYLDEMRGVIPSIDLGYDDLMNLYFHTFTLNAAGYQSETESFDALEWLACTWSNVLDASNAGLGPEYYEACKDEMDYALKRAFPDGSHWGFESSMRAVWRYAFYSIGKNDFTKLTTLVYTLGTELCICPDYYTSETTPTASGWYLSTPLTEILSSVPQSGETQFAYLRFARALEHDAYGVQWQIEFVSGDPLNKTGRNGTPNGTYDQWWFNANSDNFGHNLYVQCTGTVFNELYPGNPNGYINVIDGGGDFSGVIASPTALKGQISAGQVYAKVDLGDVATVRLKNVRLIHNINSPSHQ